MGYSRARRVSLPIHRTARSFRSAKCTSTGSISTRNRFDRLRSLSYADTHVIMICFSVERPESLENVEAKWIGEVDHYCPDVMIVLVGESACGLGPV